MKTLYILCFRLDFVLDVIFVNVSTLSVPPEQLWFAGLFLLYK